MENKINAMYIQFCGRVNNGQHIVAAAMYSDKELTQIKAVEIEEMTNFEENKVDKYDVYRNRLAEYAAALNMAYKYQNSLLVQGYDTIVLCPCNGKLFKWLSGYRVPTQVADLYENINRQFRLDGPKQLDINIGLYDKLAERKAYKFCKPEYLGAQLCRLRRGVHIMTVAEIEEAKERMAKEAARIELENLENNGVSIYDIVQVNQEDALDPVIIFDNQGGEEE